MKTKLLKLNLIVLLLCGLSVQAFAQNDTISDENNKEKAAKIDPLIKYFYKDKEEVKHLWKFDAVEWGQLNPSVAYEAKLGKKLSWEAGWIVYSLSRLDFERWNFNIDNELYLETKYYYNNGNRLKKGKNTNAFSGNYFSLCLNSFVPFSESSLVSRGFIPDSDDRIINFYDRGRPNSTLYNELNVNYGIQRRIGRIGYLDVKAGCGVGKADGVEEIQLHPRAKIRIGFGFKSLKFKKH